VFDVRHPRMFKVLAWAGPTFVVFCGGWISLIAALAQPFPGVKTWALDQFHLLWPLMTAPWFVLAVALVVVAYFVVLVYAGTGEQRATLPPVGAFHFDDHSEAAPEPKAARRDADIGEALAYTVTREWGHTLDDALLALFEPGAQNMFNEHREAALNGDVTVWGRRDRFDIWREIPKGYWADHQLNGHALTQGHARTWGNDTDAYIDLMVNRAETERRWPK
jgi:hypothetical protein